MPSLLVGQVCLLLELLVLTVMEAGTGASAVAEAAVAGAGTAAAVATAPADLAVAGATVAAAGGSLSIQQRILELEKLLAEARREQEEEEREKEFPTKALQQEIEVFPSVGDRKRRRRREDFSLGPATTTSRIRTTDLSPYEDAYEEDDKRLLLEAEAEEEDILTKHPPKDDIQKKEMKKKKTEDWKSFTRYDAATTAGLGDDEKEDIGGDSSSRRRKDDFFLQSTTTSVRTTTIVSPAYDDDDGYEEDQVEEDILTKDQIGDILMKEDPTDEEHILMGDIFVDEHQMKDEEDIFVDWNAFREEPFLFQQEDRYLLQAEAEADKGYNNNSNASLLSITAATTTTTTITHLRVAIIVNNRNGPFGKLQIRGCQEAAQLLSANNHAGNIEIVCDSFGGVGGEKISTLDDLQYNLVSDILHNNSSDSQYYYHGIAMNAVNASRIGPLLDKASSKGILVVGINQDCYPYCSQRIATVGSNSTFLGQQLAKALHQLSPKGGTVATIYAPLGLSHKELMLSFRHQLINNTLYQNKQVWTEVTSSPTVVKTIPMALQKIDDVCRSGEATAIAILLNPIFNPPAYEQIFDRYYRDNRNIYFVGVGDTPRQLDLLARRKVHGLIGQLPYEMGYQAVEIMVNQLARRNKNTTNTTTAEQQQQQLGFIGTNCKTHIQIPIELPPLQVNENRVGNLAILGYVFFALVALTSIGFAYWVWSKKETRVVKASQPTFLLMVALGILLMSSAMIPLGLDDSHSKNNSRSQNDSSPSSSSSSSKHNVAICMSVPWLICTGFSIVFSALFSKTSRVNRIFKAGSALTRIQINTRDVVLQCAALLGMNVIVLICWTIVDPLTYVRQDDPGLDEWNRVISTSGQCRSNNIHRYVIPLAVINIVCLSVANYQAYEARFLTSEFSEAKYIGIACVSMLQTAMIGIPIMIVVWDGQPQALYLVIVCMDFIVSQAVLLLIFVPKMVLHDNYTRASVQTQAQMMQRAVSNAAAVASSKSGARLSSGVGDYTTSHHSGVDPRISGLSLPSSFHASSAHPCP